MVCRRNHAFLKATLPCISLRYYLIIHCCYIYFWQAYDYIRTKKERSPELSNLPKARYILFAPFLCNATIKVFLVMTNMIHCLNPISVTKRRQGSLIKKAWNFITVRQLGTRKHMLQYLLLQVLVLYLLCVKKLTFPSTI